nr:S-methyl-5-thioribose-1-phosphate isomerase [Isoalcanivorax indicus]
MRSPALHWQGDALALLDQRLLPAETHWHRYDDADGVAQAIRDMVVRGAPAIGIAAAYGIVLAARQLGDNADPDRLRPAFATLAASRPTAVNLFWALDRMREAAATLQGQALIQALDDTACRIHQDDLAMNQRLAAFGVGLLPEGGVIYTHCNTGALATGGHGTALGVIRSAWAAGRIRGVIAGETRPWLQGSRLTSWELMQDRIPVTLVVDSAAGHLMQRGQVQAVIVGADRITANGDTANKIGTYALAVLARHHGLPFIVAAPCSTIDPARADGHSIEIEERDGAEVRRIREQQLAPHDVEVANPAFDVTPAALITAIVTEHGVIPAPDTDKMAAHLRYAESTHD